MYSDDDRRPTGRDVRAALQHFLRLHEEPTNCAAKELIDWLYTGPHRAQALDEALTLWALAGVALLESHETNSIQKDIQ